MEIRNMGIVEETKVEPHLSFRPATETLDANVVNAKEEKLGKIKEIMLDVEHGRIAYVVISFSGWFGSNSKLFAVPWEALEHSREEYILRVDKSVFEKAEGLDEGAWTLDYDKLLALYKRCGVQPYWK
jgi:sporulation protein YlmC with PRC-barrel domain